MNHVSKSQRSKWFALLHSFNVAAICALSVWHAYVFYLNNVAPDRAWSHQLELQPANQIKPTHHLIT